MLGGRAGLFTAVADNATHSFRTHVRERPVLRKITNSRYLFDLVNAMSMVQRRKVPCCAALCNKKRGESGSAIARAKRTARAKSVATARRVTGRPVTVKGKRHASVRAAAASAKAGLGAFARQAAKRRRADCYLAEVDEVRSFFPLRH